MDLRAELLAAVRALTAARLTPGKSGNISVRLGADGAMLITPTGVPYADMTAEMMVAVAGDGSLAPGGLKPSSEWPMHGAIYRARSDCAAIVHTHSTHAAAVAAMGLGIPAIHYMVGALGAAEIACAPYAVFGSEEIGANAARALGGAARACLLAHHGVIATGRNLAEALHVAGEVEWLAEVFILTRMMGGAPVLPADDMTRVIEKFKGYGQS